jgi:hypothetical protein
LCESEAVPFVKKFFIFFTINKIKNFKQMKSTTTIAVIIMLFTTLSSSGCMFMGGIDGNGNVVKETRDISSFDAISVGGAFNVILTQGNIESLVVEADENLQPIIKTRVSGNTLRITTEENIRNSKALNLYINFRELDDIDISGACNLEATNKLTFSKLNIDASGASEMDLDFSAESLTCDLSGASEIKLAGEVKDCKIESSGASEISAYDLVTENMELRASGASEAKLHATETLKVRGSGASSVRYMGNPKVDSNVSGAGSVKKR